MKFVLTAIVLFLDAFPVLAAVQEQAADPAAIEPLGTGYLIGIAAVFLAILFAVCWHYMKWDDDSDKNDPK